MGPVLARRTGCACAGLIASSVLARGTVFASDTFRRIRTLHNHPQEKLVVSFHASKMIKLGVKFSSIWNETSVAALSAEAY